MSVMDGIAIGITVCIFILFFLNGAIIISNIGNAFLEANAINSSMPTYGVFITAIDTIYAADTWTVLLYFGLWFVAILAAAFLDTNTINLPLSIFMGVITVVIAFIISNVMHAVVGNPIYSPVIAQFSQTQFLLANLGAFTALFVLVYSIVILAHPLNTGGGISHGTIVVNP
jgi:hypothetical protein